MTDNTTRSLRKDAVVNRGRLLAAAAELFAGQVAPEVATLTSYRRRSSVKGAGQTAGWDRPFNVCVSHTRPETTSEVLLV